MSDVIAETAGRWRRPMTRETKAARTLNKTEAHKRSDPLVSFFFCFKFETKYVKVGVFFLFLRAMW